MAKKKKKSQQARTRKPWSTKPLQKLTFINIEKVSRGRDFTKITKSGLHFSPQDAETLGITKGSFILIAFQDKTLYIGKRPKGLFGGHKVSQSTKGSKLYWINFKSTLYKLPFGQYRLGKSVRTSLVDHFGHEIKFDVFIMEPI